ncbi:uncharacterized protein FIBRA_08529 [Fibroporia radiculosa]|uniref:DNA ligase n=1 Tax=Fibroporia radiculosa TaxID=599839 RepID=J4GHM4_9APHY|nr:uncharacterized protein FIBRA_08529 [Fibroporia radiculosa]CCM06278.1 predicted protein [Fibroporia radiculosa]
MLPTPAPTSPPSSPRPEAVAAENHEIVYPAPPKNSSSAPFHVLAALFDKLQNERKPEKRRKLLDSWFNKDRERAVYGLKEKNLAKTYIKLIPLGPRDPDAIRLLNWKKPTEREKSSGDFPTVLYEVISKRSSVIEGTLTIDEVNDVLDELSRNMGKSDVQSRLLQRVYNRSTPEEQRWIVRIVLKDMIISVKETTVFSVFHPDAHDLFNTCSDLKKIAWELWDPNRRLNEEDKGVQLFRAFAPMLCKRPTRKIEDSVREMQGRTFIVEEKLDGERMQLHKRGNEYFYCSRKGKDYTYLYGKHVGMGSLTPYIHSAFDLRVDEIVLDGEMLVWDPVSERNLPFGTLKTAALDKSKRDYNPRPCFKVFDLLYLNGMSLLQKSLKFRKRNLRACLKEVSGRIEYAVEYEGRTAKDVRERMNDIIASRGEGLVLKHPDSEYVLNGRNRDWIKVKPEYMDNMGETVDVLVVGWSNCCSTNLFATNSKKAGNYGTGRRAGGVSTLICAVLDDRHPEDDDESKYSTFVRIGSGLSYADYIWVRQRSWKTWDLKNPPSFLHVSKRGQEDKGDVYLEPEDSFIIKVKAAEIVTSDQYHMGLTMRFPRALKIRDDLDVSDCMRASAVLEGLRSEQKRKLEDDDGKPKKKQKRTAKKISLMPEYQGIKVKNVEIETDLLEGMKFMVASDPKSRSGEEDKKQLLQLIHAHGGSYVQVVKADPEILVVYGGASTPYDIKLIMNKGICDIIKPQWIMDCIARGDLIPMSKKYFFHATERRQQDDDYNLADDDEDEADPSASGSPVRDAEMKESNITEGEVEEDDSSMADWFKVKDPSIAQEDHRGDADSETEPDSDNEDITCDEDANPDEDGDDDWIDVKLSQARSSDVAQNGSEALGDSHATPAEADGQGRMGENHDAMEYDTELIFRHLCFYLDSPVNARKHDMTVNPKNEDALTRSFDKLSLLITKNGGHVADLDKPTLTHVVLDKRDITRRSELIKRTSKPKRRHLIIAEFIQACLDEDTLLDEDEFAP